MEHHNADKVQQAREIIELTKAKMSALVDALRGVDDATKLSDNAKIVLADGVAMYVCLKVFGETYGQKTIKLINDLGDVVLKAMRAADEMSKDKD